SRPPTIRDFYAFEAHVKNARGRRGLPVPAEWYEFPAFYFSNPGTLVGDGAPVSKPSWTEALDYELEIACVIGTRARNVPIDQWRSVVAGLTILNDWSARDVQRKEMAIGLGPAKGKDFATSLGPALVTLDEVEPKRSGDRYDLAMEARVNGATLSRGNAKDMHYTLGETPHKRHTQFRRPDGKLYTEQLMGSRGFSGRSSLIYHYNMPTQANEIHKVQDCRVQYADDQVLRHHHFKTKDLKKSGDPVTGRVVLLHNKDVSMAIAVPDQKMKYYYRNGQGDDMYFIHEGAGRIQTIFGELHYRPGDYVVIPRGTSYMFHPEPGP